MFNFFSLIVRYTPSKRFYLKLISLGLVFTFLGQELLMAAPDGFGVRLAAPFDNFQLPDSVALIREKFSAPGADRSIVLIQDAHTNESAQLNIAKAIDHILVKEQKIKHVFLEAGTGNDSLSYLRRFSSIEKREKVARSFLRRGLIQGPDYLDLTSDKAFSLWGVENKKLYWEGLALYRDLKKDRELLVAGVDRLKRAKKTLATRLWSPALQKMDSGRESFLRGELGAADYFDALVMEARKLGVPLEVFPHLSKLTALKNQEKEIDFKKASLEEAALVASLPESERTSLLAVAAKLRQKDAQNLREVQDAFYSLLKEKIKNPLFYVHLSKYIEYLVNSRGFDAEVVLKEREDLEKIVFGQLAGSRDSRRLLEAARAVEILERLWQLEISKEDFEAIQKNLGAHSFLNLAGFFNLKLIELGSHTEDTVLWDEKFGTDYDKAIKFYSLTLERDEAFVENMLKKMDRAGEKKAILVTGGFHTEHLKDLLRARGISYAVVIPRILQETNKEKYESLLLGQIKKNSSKIKNSAKADAWAIIPPAENRQIRIQLSEGVGRGLAAARLASAKLGGKHRVSYDETLKKDKLGKKLREIFDRSRVKQKFFLEQIDLALSVKGHSDVRIGSITSLHTNFFGGMASYKTLERVVSVAERINWSQLSKKIEGSERPVRRPTVAESIESLTAVQKRELIEKRKQSPNGQLLIKEVAHVLGVTSRALGIFFKKNPSVHKAFLEANPIAARLAQQFKLDINPGKSFWFHDRRSGKVFQVRLESIDTIHRQIQLQVSENDKPIDDWGGIEAKTYESETSHKIFPGVDDISIVFGDTLTNSRVGLFFPHFPFTVNLRRRNTEDQPASITAFMAETRRQQVLDAWEKYLKGVEDYYLSDSPPAANEVSTALEKWINNSFRSPDAAVEPDPEAIVSSMRQALTERTRLSRENIDNEIQDARLIMIEITKPISEKEIAVSSVGRSEGRFELVNGVLGQQKLALRAALKAYFESRGLPTEDADAVANTLVRMTPDGIKLLIRWGILSGIPDEQSLENENLFNKIKPLITVYDQKYPDKKELLLKYLLPESILELMAQHGLDRERFFRILKLHPSPIIVLLRLIDEHPRVDLGVIEKKVIQLRPKTPISEQNLWRIIALVGTEEAAAWILKKTKDVSALSTSISLDRAWDKVIREEELQGARLADASTPDISQLHPTIGDIGLFADRFPIFSRDKHGLIKSVQRLAMLLRSWIREATEYLEHGTLYYYMIEGVPHYKVTGLGRDQIVQYLHYFSGLVEDWVKKGIVDSTEASILSVQVMDLFSSLLKGNFDSTQSHVADEEARAVIRVAENLLRFPISRIGWDKEFDKTPFWLEGLLKGFPENAAFYLGLPILPAQENAERLSSDYAQFEDSDHPVFITSYESPGELKSQRIVYVNPAFLKMVGGEKKDWIGKNYFEKNQRELAEKYTRDDKNAMNMGPGQFFHETETNRSGQNRQKPVTVETVKLPFYNYRGKWVGVLAMFDVIQGEQSSYEMNPSLQRTLIRVLRQQQQLGVGRQPRLARLGILEPINKPAIGVGVLAFLAALTVSSLIPALLIGFLSALAMVGIQSAVLLNEVKDTTLEFVLRNQILYQRQTRIANTDIQQHFAARVKSALDFLLNLTPPTLETRLLGKLSAPSMGWKNFPEFLSENRAAVERAVVRRGLRHLKAAATAPSYDGARLAMADKLKNELLEEVSDINRTEYFELEGYHILLSFGNKGKINGIAVGREDQESIHAMEEDEGRGRVAEVTSLAGGVLITTYTDQKKTEVAERWHVGMVTIEGQPRYRIATMELQGEALLAGRGVAFDDWRVDEEGNPAARLAATVKDIPLSTRGSGREKQLFLEAMVRHSDRVVVSDPKSLYTVSKFGDEKAPKDPNNSKDLSNSELASFLRAKANLEEIFKTIPELFPEAQYPGLSEEIRQSMAVVAVMTDTYLLAPISLSPSYRWGRWRNSRSRPILYASFKDLSSIRSQRDRIGHQTSQDIILAAYAVVHGWYWYKTYKQNQSIPADKLSELLANFEKQWDLKEEPYLSFRYKAKTAWHLFWDRFALARHRRERRKDFEFYREHLNIHDETVRQILVDAGQTGPVIDRTTTESEETRSHRNAFTPVFERLRNFAEEAMALGDFEQALLIAKEAKRFLLHINIVDSGQLPIEVFIRYLKLLFRTGHYQEFLKSIQEFKDGFISIDEQRIQVPSQEKGWFTKLLQIFEPWFEGIVLRSLQIMKDSPDKQNLNQFADLARWHLREIKSEVQRLDATAARLAEAPAISMFEDFPDTKDFVSPIEYGKKVSGTFMPFHHMRHLRDWGIGNFESAIKMAGVFKKLGLKIMQILPLIWSDAFNSPYSEASSRAIDLRYISVPMLVDQLTQEFGEKIEFSKYKEFLAKNKSQIEAVRTGDVINHEEVIRLNKEALEAIWENLSHSPEFENSKTFEAFKTFKSENDDWLEDHMLYLLLKEENMARDPYNGWDWRTWVDASGNEAESLKIRQRDPAKIDALKKDPRYSSRIALYSYIQFVAYSQYDKFVAEAKKQGVDVAVDVPFARGGADIWMNPEIFGLRKENGYQRPFTHGSLPEETYNIGQYWQFFAYDWKQPGTLKYMLKLFEHYQKMAPYIRIDHALGFYMPYLFMEDGKGEFTLQKLGIFEDVSRIVQAAKAEIARNVSRTDEIKERAAREVTTIFIRALKNSEQVKANPLVERLVNLAYPNDTEALSEYAMMYVAREAKKTNEEYETLGDPWVRVNDVVEAKVFDEGDKRRPVWNYIRLTKHEFGKKDPNDRNPNEKERRDYKNGMIEYLFGSEEPKPEDNLRVASYDKGPGEEFLSPLLKLARQKGTTVISEALARFIPDGLEKPHLSAYDYVCSMWGKEKEGADKNIHNPRAHQPYAFRTYSLHDTKALRGDWKEATKEKKTQILNDLGISPTEENLSELTPQVHKALLKLSFDSDSLMVVIGWLDILGYDDDRKLNKPGETGHWKNRLLVSAEMLDAVLDGKTEVGGEPISEDVRTAVNDLRELTAEREASSQRELSEKIERTLIRHSPDMDNHRIEVEQFRDGSNTQIEPFLIESYVSSTAENVSVKIRYRDNAGQIQENEFSMVQDTQASTPEGISRYSIALKAGQVGEFEFQIEAKDESGSTISSEKGYLYAVAHKEGLNPTSGDYFMKKREYSSLSVAAARLAEKSTSLYQRVAEALRLEGIHRIINHPGTTHTTDVLNQVFRERENLVWSKLLTFLEQQRLEKGADGIYFSPYFSVRTLREVLKENATNPSGVSFHRGTAGTTLDFKLSARNPREIVYLGLEAAESAGIEMNVNRASALRVKIREGTSLMAVYEPGENQLVLARRLDDLLRSNKKEERERALQIAKRDILLGFAREFTRQNKYGAARDLVEHNISYPPQDDPVVYERLSKQFMEDIVTGDDSLIFVTFLRALIQLSQQFALLRPAISWFQNWVFQRLTSNAITASDLKRAADHLAISLEDYPYGYIALRGLAGYIRDGYVSGQPDLDMERVWAPWDLLATFEEVYRSSQKRSAKVEYWLHRVKSSWQARWKKHLETLHYDQFYGVDVQKQNGLEALSPKATPLGVEFNLSNHHLEKTIDQEVNRLKANGHEDLDKLSRILGSKKDTRSIVKALVRSARKQPETVSIAGNFLENKPFGMSHIHVGPHSRMVGDLEQGWKTRRQGVYSKGEGWIWTVAFEVPPSAFKEPKHIQYKYVIHLTRGEETYDFWLPDPSVQEHTTDGYHSSVIKVSPKKEEIKRMTRRDPSPGVVSLQLNLALEAPSPKSLAQTKFKNPVQWLTANLQSPRFSRYRRIQLATTLTLGTAPWLSGYAPAAYTSDLGQSEDFRALEKRARELGVELVYDFVAGHTDPYRHPLPLSSYSYADLGGGIAGTLSIWSHHIDDQNPQSVAQLLWWLKAVGIPSTRADVGGSISQWLHLERSRQEPDATAIVEWGDTAVQDPFTELYFKDIFEALERTSASVPFNQMLQLLEDKLAGLDADKRLLMIWNNHDESQYQGGVGAFVKGLDKGTAEKKLMALYTAYIILHLTHLNRTSVLEYSPDRFGFTGHDVFMFGEYGRRERPKWKKNRNIDFIRLHNKLLAVANAVAQEKTPAERVGTNNSYVGAAITTINDKRQLILTNVSGSHQRGNIWIDGKASDFDLPAYGVSIQDLRSLTAARLAYKDEVRAYADQADNVVSDLLQKAPDLAVIQNHVTRLVYPAAGNDVKTVVSLMKVFPKVNHLYVIDTAYQGPPAMNGRTWKDYWEERIREAARENGVTPDPNLVVSVISRDYHFLNHRDIPVLPAGQHTVVIESRWPHGIHFMEQIFKQNREGDVVIAFKPPHTVREYLNPQSLAPDSVQGLSLPYLYESRRYWIATTLRSISEKSAQLQRAAARLAKSSLLDQKVSQMIAGIRGMDGHLLELTQIVQKEMKAGLKGKKSSLPMIPSSVPVPDLAALVGQRVVYADLGGSTIHIGAIEIGNGGNIKVLWHEDIKLGDNISIGGRKLFDYIAQEIATSIKRHQKQGSKDITKMSFTFSFSHQDGKILPEAHGTKGFDFKNVVGRNVKNLVNRRLKKLGVGGLRVVVVANDTEGAMILGNLTLPRVIFSVIAGTGFNTAVWIDGTLYNMESGGLVIPKEWLTPHDLPLVKRGAEELIAGKFLGEQLRVRLLDLAKNDNLFSGRISKKLTIEEGISSKNVSRIYLARSDKKVQSILYGLGIRQVSPRDIQAVRQIAAALFERSYKVNAAIIAGGFSLEPIKTKSPQIAADGALWNIPAYLQGAQRQLRSLAQKLDISGEPKIHQVQNASGVGVGAIAAVVTQAPTGARLATSPATPITYGRDLASILANQLGEPKFFPLARLGSNSQIHVEVVFKISDAESKRLSLTLMNGATVNHPDPSKNARDFFTRKLDISESDFDQLEFILTVDRVSQILTIEPKEPKKIGARLALRRGLSGFAQDFSEGQLNALKVFIWEAAKAKEFHGEFPVEVDPNTDAALLRVTKNSSGVAELWVRGGTEPLLTVSRQEYLGLKHQLKSSVSFSGLKDLAAGVNAQVDFFLNQVDPHIDHDKPVALELDTKYLDSVSESYLEAFILHLETEAEKVYGKNVYFLPIGKSASQWIQRAPKIFSTEPPQGLSEIRRVKVVPPAQANDLSKRDLPLLPLGEGDLPLFSFIRLAIYEGRLPDITNRPEAFDNAYATLAGGHPESSILTLILSGKADAETAAQHAVRALLRVDVNLAIRFVDHMRRMLAQSA